MNDTQTRYPKDLRDKTGPMFAEGLSAREVAEKLNVPKSAVGYWRTQCFKLHGKGNGVAKAMKKRKPKKKKAGKAKPDARVALAIHCLREARRLIEKDGGRQSKVELYTLLALTWLEGDER